jgi:uncharacterized protein
MKMHHQKAPYAIIAKPIGPLCNLACKYCFYLEKQQLFHKKSRFRMSYEVLEAFIRQYITSQDFPEVVFSWQGGEPTLLGVDYFCKVVELQKKYANGKKISNALQTNGVLLDDKWCEFLTENQFLVGLSIDGPEDLHDCFRVDKHQRPTFDSVMKGVEFLKKHSTQFNTLTVVNDTSSRKPLDVYRFLKEVCEGFMQFIPLIELKPDKEAKALGLDLGMPPDRNKNKYEPSVTEWSVKPGKFGEFYTQIFDEWVRCDVGKVFVQFFDVALGNWMGLGSGLCVFAPTCGHASVLEHNGDLYTCDHYVYPQYKLGNILERPLDELMDSNLQRQFGLNKLDLLPQDCVRCEVRFACNGECPKHRFLGANSGEPQLSYLCSAYQRIFKHMNPYMKVMTGMVSSGKEASLVMDYVAGEDRQKLFNTAKRNDPCPCGSGKKFKKCCGS